ncbi:MAG: serine protease [Pirellula sp.]
MPMGGAAGTTVEVAITGENLEDAGDLLFDHPGIQATAKRDANGKLEPNKYMISIAPDCPLGLFESRVTSRLGISSARIFSVGNLGESIPSSPNTTLATAAPLAVNSVCNAVVSSRAVDHYAFEAQAGKRYIVHCCSRGIDSKLDPVVILADASGRDLKVERTGNTLDFTAAESGKHIIKIHELTFKGGPGYFYRLVLQELAADAPIPVFPSTQSVSAFSWPPANLPETPSVQEDENADGQTIALPCDLSGRFFPAADVDTYQFTANQGDVWWIEVASERLGRPTDPSIVVQQSQGQDAEQKWVDLMELNDIASPVKVSSNGYAYDGPPFDGGSTDILGKLEIKETGTYRILLTDLFGGTRKDPRNTYRLIVRKAAPDFAVVSWGLHMELRNGDRNALSKPLALRAGGTIALEVVAVRRDGFDGEINLTMEGLPQGVSAHGLKIAAGKSRGIVLLTASESATQSLSQATLIASATINDQLVSHPVRTAQMAWPVPDAWSEIPSPRLVRGLPVSVTTSETAPLTISATESKVYEVKAGEKLSIPLRLTARSEFSGAVLQLKTFGPSFEGNPPFDVSLTSPSAEAIVNLASIKPAAGDYTIAFYGTAVAKYRYNPLGVSLAENDVKKAEAESKRISEELAQQTQALASNPVEKKAEVEQAIAALNVQKQAADATLAAANATLKNVTAQAAPRDTAEIIISEPITIRVNP